MSSTTVSSPPPSSSPKAKSAGVSREDLMLLTKARLSMMVVITAGMGGLLAMRSTGTYDWFRLLHTILGSAFTAGAAAVFNQLLEVEIDSRMERTAGRPLPAGRVTRESAFVIGWILGAFGLIHLSAMVNPLAAFVAAATLATYVFVYTPMKRATSANTLIGAVTGALPPLIGWFGLGGNFGTEAVFLFALLFFWQMPHFIAINWICREDYERAGLVMWAHGDHDGRRSAILSLLFSLALTASFALPWAGAFAHWWSATIGALVSLSLAFYSWQWYRQLTREAARRLFFATLLYLPIALVLTILFWKS